MGPMLKRFEKELAAYHGAEVRHRRRQRHGRALAGVRWRWASARATKCITHPNTFFATAEAIWIAGATAVFVDCDPKTNCIDPAKIEAAITPKTKAIVPVHLYGQCADMKAIRKIADKHKLFVIEDNAQAIGARGDGFKIGELSDAVCTSFIIQKNLGTFGDGGAVVTNNAEIDRIVRKLRNHGSDKRSCHSFGFNSRLDDLHAGVLSAKLKHIDEWNDLRRAVGGPLHRVPEGRAEPHAALRDARLPSRLSSLCHRDQEARAPRRAAGFPERRTASTPSATTPSPSTSRKVIRGAAGAHRRRDRQRRAQRGLLHLAADVPRTDRRGSGLRHREGPRVGRDGG